MGHTREDGWKTLLLSPYSFIKINNHDAWGGYNDQCDGKRWNNKRSREIFIEL